MAVYHGTPTSCWRLVVDVHVNDTWSPEPDCPKRSVASTVASIRYRGFLRHARNSSDDMGTYGRSRSGPDKSFEVRSHRRSTRRLLAVINLAVVGIKASIPGMGSKALALDVATDPIKLWVLVTIRLKDHDNVTVLVSLFIFNTIPGLLRKMHSVRRNSYNCEVLPGRDPSTCCAWPTEINPGLI